MQAVPCVWPGLPGVFQCKLHKCLINQSPLPGAWKWTLELLCINPLNSLALNTANSGHILVKSVFTLRFNSNILLSTCFYNRPLSRTQTFPDFEEAPELLHTNAKPLSHDEWMWTWAECSQECFDVTLLSWQRTFWLFSGLEFFGNTRANE